MDSLRRLRLAAWFAVTGVLLPRALYAQLSPGELSAAHAGLEGLSNCTRCHAVGHAIANDKCLDCHTELKSRIRQNTGFHASLAGRECIECHKEHHGRSFSIVRFDLKAFDHAKATGFALDGKHARVMCASCHKPQFIAAPDVRSNPSMMHGTTYLGLEQSCKGCHPDVHRGQFAAPCQSCHTTERWKPLSRFSHDRARFRLVGLHAGVPCAGCHKPLPTDAGVVRFTGIAFDRCVDCHADPHRGKLKGDCTACHTPAGWKQSASRFDHAATGFPLRGLHAGERCELCHAAPSGIGGKRVLRFARFARCADCHRDPHNGQFAKAGSKTVCERCHTEDGWREGVMKGFDHATTGFPLRGKHRQVPCMDCHGRPGTSHVVLSTLEGAERCAGCHVDPHGGQFRRGATQRDCGECHRESGFFPTSYDAVQHRTTRMVLDGAHSAVPCNKCHERVVENGKAIQLFAKDAPPRCVDCHQDPHRGDLDSWKPACVACHTTNTWKDIRFRHDQTRFRLEGSHAGLSCASCHNAGGKTTNVESWKFRRIPMKCEGCHDAAPVPGQSHVRQGARNR